MMRLLVFLGVVALAVGGAFILITERAAATRAGYRIAALERERLELIEQNRQLEARAAKLRTAAYIAEKAAGFHLDVVPPEDSLRGKDKEKEKRPEPSKRR